MEELNVKIHLENNWKLIQNIFEKENLISLSDNNYIYKELNVLEILNFRNDSSRFQKFDIFKIKTDILNCNNDLKLFIALLFLYRPYINNPLEEYKFIKSVKFYTYFKKMEDWFYSTYVSCAYEKLYNFWDRIGDVLAYCFELEIEERSVGYPIVIDKLEKLGIYNNNPHFIFLKEFKGNEYKVFNDERKDIVHYYQYETTYWENFLSNNRNETEIIKLWEEKRKKPEYFKKQLELSCEGYYNMYKFIQAECLKISSTNT